MPGTWSYDEWTKTVQVTGGTEGSPADFASFVAADRAGTAELLAATAGAKGMSLTYQVRPVEKLAITINFIVAAKTAETDYIFVTGTAFDGSAQSEAINVSAGNGTYNGTKKWATITQIDCEDVGDGSGNAWADGTLQVTQGQWGIIWDYGYKSYKIEGPVIIGDSATSTYFGDQECNIVLDGANWITANSWKAFSVKTQATMRLGTVVSATDKTTRYGCHITMQNTGGYWGNPIDTGYGNTSTLLLYSCAFRAISSNALMMFNYNASHRVWNCALFDRIELSRLKGVDVFNVQATYVDNLVRRPDATATLEQVAGNYVANYVNFQDGPGEVFNVWGRNTYQHCVLVQNVEEGEDCTITNGDFGTDDWTFIWLGTTGALVYRKYTVDIHVADQDGSDLQGAIVTMEDKDENQAFSVSTDSNGNIATQTVTRGSYTSTDGDTITEKSPHKITISKDGYETLVIDNITLTNKLEWHFELNPLRHPVAVWTDER